MGIAAGGKAHTSPNNADETSETKISITQQRAYWLTADTIVWTLSAPTTTTYRLYAAPDGGLASTGESITGGTAYPLSYEPAGLPPTLKDRHPHLADLGVLRLTGVSTDTVRALLSGQLAVAAFHAPGAQGSGPDAPAPDSSAPDALGPAAAASGLQIAGVLDDVYPGAATRTLGPTWQDGTPTLSLWAPTAKSVTISLHNDPSIPLHPSGDGVWTVTGEPSWKGLYYLFDVEVYVPETGKVEHNLVTDPYSVALSTNSVRSQLADLDDPALEPPGWRTLAKPPPGSPAAQSIYELHVRDFSIGDSTVPAAHRGTYLAFATVPNADANAGMRHLAALAKAGLTTVHLLPTADLSSVNEVRADQESPACDLASYPPDSERQQACIAAVADTDGFNWGYDPLHYTTPEGSYATDPEGAARTKEFRTMVAGLNEAGLRVVMDVVYNHTSSAGQAGANNLDRIVPGYYHRLDADGAVTTSTCGPNTATEHMMMAKLLIDSVLTWATKYKVDGFRFDLMGHQPKAVMVALRRALDKISVVSGQSRYLYGEGWDFGEVANNARFPNANQVNMAGTGIGTFNDRLRDAVRGGSPFDTDPREQGFASGLYTDPNGAAVNGTPDEQRATLLRQQDQVKVGLAGNLKSMSGYNEDPREAVTFVEAHDNLTLFDALAYKLPRGTSMADRIRMQILALSTTALSQGVSFWHAGAEFLRSKSFDGDSYNSGDWFNVYDPSMRTNGFGRGLPPAEKNSGLWSYAKPLLADATLTPSSAEIALANAQAQTLLRLRASTPLFSLGSAALIERKVSFPIGGPDQPPGVIVLHIDDTAGPDVDPALSGLVVVFNAGPGPTTQAVPGTAGREFTLCPIQATGPDPVVKSSTFTAGSFTVPARTVSVFVAR